MSLDGEPVVVVGMACRFPDANDPATLLRNTIEGRQSFRPIPPERLVLADYAADSVGLPDSITRVPAGLLTDWRFDAGRFRVPRAAYEGADLAHWLALEVAADAIESSGVGDLLDRDATAVIVANTLTGEFSRTHTLRLRWPWLDQQLTSVLASGGMTDAQVSQIRTGFRDRLLAAFRTPDEESLAGGLSNTIAGRIANHFDLHGGAFTVDAACASSLVAVADAAGMIAAGRIRAAIVAAVDLSLDPFELVGFSRNGALAPNRMRVFDERAEGFWPGEGAGALVLMAEAEARRAGLDFIAHLAGWAVATDGRGGLTRPSVDGQHRAVARAFAHAGAEPSEVGYVEAHGTGTAVGDPTEVRALASFIGDSRRYPLPIGSIKANIGHTKAAAGLAGLIRTAAAISDGVVPPHTGCERPHPIFAETDNRVRVVMAAEQWPRGKRVAGVSSFGFGGINAHVVLTAPQRRRRRPPPPTPARQDFLFLFRAAELSALRKEIEALASRAPTLSYSEVGDAAARAAGRLAPGDFRLAFRAADPEELLSRLASAANALNGAVLPDIRFGRSDQSPRVGLVFPGQAAPVRLSGGAWSRLFPGQYPDFVADGDPARTDNAQPAIIAACVAAIDLLARLGVDGDAAVGHSLGELAALGWAGALPREALVGLATVRGKAMADLEPGAMLQLGCDAQQARDLADGLAVVPACFNSGLETVMSGDFAAIAVLERRAEDAGVPAARLNVSHPFHSPSMGAAAGAMQRALASIQTRPLQRAVASTVTGEWLPADADIAQMLVRQLTAPVRFTDAVAALVERVDVMIEAGPGAGLARLLTASGTPVLSLDVFSETMAPALDALAALFALGADINPAPLFKGPGVRELRMQPPRLISSPCGSAASPAPALTVPAPTALPSEIPSEAHDGALPLLVEMVAVETGLDRATISPDHRFLDDLHLNSLAVNRILTRLGNVLGLGLPKILTALANAHLREAAEAFDDLRSLDGPEPPERVAGVAPWVRRFTIAKSPLPERPDIKLHWCDTTLDEPTFESAEGVLIRLVRSWDAARDAAPLLHLCQRAVGRYRHLAIAHADAPLSGFGRSIAGERLFESVRLIQGSPDPRLLRRQVSGFEDIILEPDGRYTVPVLAVTDSGAPELSSSPGTTVVTGGGRGIGAECALRLAERHRCPIILVGRAPRTDADVASTLARSAASGAVARYVQADVTDDRAIFGGVAEAASELGPVTHLVHAAGLNHPTAFEEIQPDLLEKTIAPKTAGLSTAIDACGGSLRRVIAFGSIIGRLGLAGEAHYALANAEQTRLLMEIAKARRLSALSIEWSVWGAAGMGERLGVLEQLAAGGVDALTLDQALDEFESLALGKNEGALVVSSRFGSTASAARDGPLRFIEQTLVHTSGVELVAETRVGTGRDPYLSDHRLGEEPLVPAVMLLEAMAEAVRSLTAENCLTCTNVRFDAAVYVGDAGVGLRTGVLLDGDGSIRAEVRSSADAYNAPCAIASWRSDDTASEPLLSEGLPDFEAGALYGPLFFQGPAFRCLAALGRVTSRTVDAWFEERTARDWFGSFEPQRLILGDPGARDAALHALQCCVPHRRLVPISAERIEFHRGGAPARLQARERWSKGGNYAFDILVADKSGQVVEVWREAVFRAVGETDITSVLAAAPTLRRAWLERLAREATADETISLVLVDDPTVDREERRERAASELGLARAPLVRGDGKPLPVDGRSVSFAHSDGVTIAVTSAHEVGCDVERIAEFAAAELALTWTAEETLRKLGSRATLTQATDGLFTGDSLERIAAFAPVPTAGAGAVAVAIGTAAPK